MSYTGGMRLVLSLATATAALMLGLPGAGVGGAFAASGAPAADPNGDGTFDDLAAQVADAPVSARVDVIVTLDRPATAAVVATLQEQVGPFSPGRLFTVVDGFSATVTGPQVALLAAAPAVVQIERNGTVGISNQPGNLAFSATQARLDLPDIDPAHVDIAGKVVAFVDCLLPDLAPMCSVVPAFDDHGHGSHVAGTIAGTGAAGGGAERGVAPGATLVGVKVLDATGSGSEVGVIAGIQWVIANRATYGIRAINMSLSDTGCSDGIDALSQAANEAAAGGGYATVAPLPGEAGRERIEFALRVTTGGVVYGKQLTLRFREGGLSYVLRTSAIDNGGLFLAPGATPQCAFFLGAAAVAQIAANGVETPLPGVYRVTVDTRDLAEPGAGFDTFAAWVGTPSGTTFHQAGSSAAQLVLASGNVAFRR